MYSRCISIIRDGAKKTTMFPWISTDVSSNNSRRSNSTCTSTNNRLLWATTWPIILSVSIHNTTGRPVSVTLLRPSSIPDRPIWPSTKSRSTENEPIGPGWSSSNQILLYENLNIIFIDDPAMSPWLRGTTRPATRRLSTDCGILATKCFCGTANYEDLPSLLCRPLCLG